jgi:hypothetical protein
MPMGQSRAMQRNSREEFKRMSRNNSDVKKYQSVEGKKNEDHYCVF